MDADAVRVRRHRRCLPIVTRPSTKSAGRVGKRQRVPAQPVRRRLGLAAGRGAHQPVVDAAERPVHRRRADAVQPGAPVLGARRGERRARELLGVEAERRHLRRVLAPRQRAGHRLGGELVAEARQVGRFRLARGRLSAFSHSDPGVRTYHAPPARNEPAAARHSLVLQQKNSKTVVPAPQGARPRA